MQAIEIVGRIKMHAACALHYRFKNNCSDLFLIFTQCFFHRLHIVIAAGFTKSTCRCIDKKLLIYAVRKDLVHSGDWVAHRHRAKSIAVITASNSQKFLFVRVTGAMTILYCHFHRYFNRNRSRLYFGRMGIVKAKRTPASVACTPLFSIATHSTTPSNI